MAGLKETYKDRSYQHKSKAEDFWITLVLVIGAAWFLPELLFPGISDNTSIVKRIQEHGFIDGILSLKIPIMIMSVLFYSLWVSLYFEYDKSIIKKIIDKFSPNISKSISMSVYADGYLVRIKKIIYQKVKITDGVERGEIKLFKGMLLGDDAKKLLFGEETAGFISMFAPLNEKIKKSPNMTKKARGILFEERKNRFIDLMQIIEKRLDYREIEGGLVRVYEEVDDNDDYINFRSVRLTDDGTRVFISVNAIRALIHDAGEDFRRFYEKTLNMSAKTKLRKKLSEHNALLESGFDANKATMIFKFLIFHEIMTGYMGLSPGFVVNKFEDYDIRVITDRYNYKDTTIKISRENSGKDKKFQSDVFPRMFLILYHTYMKSTKNFDWEFLFCNFNPHCLEGKDLDLVTELEQSANLMMSAANKEKSSFEKLNNKGE